MTERGATGKSVGAAQAAAPIGAQSPARSTARSAGRRARPTKLPAPRPCSIAAALDVVGDRWSLLIVREVFYGARRFDEIARNTGAPRDILAARLRLLVDAGVLGKRPYSDRPARFDYHLTAAGRDLSPVLLTLKRWGETHLAGGEPPVVFGHTCGAVFEAEVSCAACGEPLRPGDLSLVHAEAPQPAAPNAPVAGPPRLTPGAADTTADT
jgi:DNA-binding HxlR family transcriptional regulator